jgi:mannosyltransferase
MIEQKMSWLKKYEQVIILLIIVVLNTCVKGAFLASNSLGGDEPFSVYHAQMDIVSIVRLLSEGNNPPLYEMFLHFWIKFFGISEFAVRFPSLLFSSITVLFIYKIGVNHLNKRIAFYASFLFVFSNYHILFAHEARVYAMLGMLSTCSVYYYLELLRFSVACIEGGVNDVLKSKTVKNVIALIVLNTLLIYSHYFGFFILLTQFLFTLHLKKVFLAYWKQVLACVLIIGLAYLPNIIVLLNRFVESSSNGTWLTSPNGIDSLYNMLRQFSNAPVVAALVIVVFLSSLIKYVIKKRDLQLSVATKFIIFWFVFIFFFMFSISYSIPMFLDRYLMPVSIAFILTLAISIDTLVNRPRFKYIIPFVICLLFCVTVKPNLTNKRNVRQVVEKIKEIKDPSTLVLICPKYFMLDFVYYYNQETFTKINTDASYTAIENDLEKDNIYAIYNINEIDYSKWKRIVFLDAAADFAYPDNNVKNSLEANYNLVNHYPIYEIFNVFEYELR